MAASDQRKHAIGIFGGTFDPPHLGHLVAAETVREKHGLDEVIFIPSGVPPHKEAAGVTPSRHRFVMTALATLGHPHFITSRIEMERPPPSFTVDTLKQLAAEHDDDTDFYFIIGADALLQLPTWKQPDEVLRRCRMVAVTRPGFSYTHLGDSLGELYVEHADRILITEIPSMAIAASDIRERVESGQSIRYLVPDMVREYIATNNLYRTP